MIPGALTFGSVPFLEGLDAEAAGGPFELGPHESYTYKLVPSRPFVAGGNAGSFYAWWDRAGLAVGFEVGDTCWTMGPVVAAEIFVSYGRRELLAYVERLELGHNRPDPSPLLGVVIPAGQEVRLVVHNYAERRAEVGFVLVGQWWLA